jgi:hypothetical protein
MAKDERDLLELLKAELDFIENAATDVRYVRTWIALPGKPDQAIGENPAAQSVHCVVLLINSDIRIEKQY